MSKHWSLLRDEKQRCDLCLELFSLAKLSKKKKAIFYLKFESLIALLNLYKIIIKLWYLHENGTLFVI